MPKLDDKNTTNNTDKNDNDNDDNKERENTETSMYVAEFSRTKTIMTQRSIIAPNNLYDASNNATMLSLYFEQYNVMKENQRRLTELSRNTTNNNNSLQPSPQYKNVTIFANRS